MKIGAIIQARLSSSRLPEKVLKKLPFGSETTVLEQVVKRVKKSSRINNVIVATSRCEEDKKIVELCKEKNIDYFQGSLYNVLERFYKTAKKFNLDLIVRITADCPCLDPKIIDEVIDLHLKEKSDYTATAVKRTFPHGIDFCVFNFKSLKEAFENAKYEYEKEHVTTYFYKTKPENYKIINFEAKGKFNRPDIRVTLDTEEDYTLLCAVYDFLYYENELFDLETIINLFEKKSWMLNINKNVFQKQVFEDLQDELEFGKKICEKLDLKRIDRILEKFQIEF